ncbi:hypothetical protein SO694_000028107 [Aureococcus anophagefferens]|uniref:Uncharacterized protein n=1 Tax=Aureococcus anophagefferens TaxID=44056 RepID=A0ABR1GDK7_AURAN
MAVDGVQLRLRDVQSVEADPDTLSFLQNHKDFDQDVRAAINERGCTAKKLYSALTAAGLEAALPQRQDGSRATRAATGRGTAAAAALPEPEEADARVPDEHTMKELCAADDWPHRFSGPPRFYTGDEDLDLVQLFTEIRARRMADQTSMALLQVTSSLGGAKPRASGVERRLRSVQARATGSPLPRADQAVVADATAANRASEAAATYRDRRENGVFALAGGPSSTLERIMASAPEPAAKKQKRWNTTWLSKPFRAAMGTLKNVSAKNVRNHFGGISRWFSKQLCDAESKRRRRAAAPPRPRRRASCRRP